MPFLGVLNDTLVTPAWVSPGTTVTCPACENEMFVRGGPETKRVRHFIHYTNGGLCSGESTTHQRWKQLAYRGLAQLKLETLTSVFFCVEGRVDVSDTPSEQETRRADVLVRFSESHAQFGEGIVIEVQHTNTEKDKHAVTYDYLSEGYSVFWAGRHEFRDDAFDAEAMIFDSDESRQFFRTGAITGELPSFGDFVTWEFDRLAELLDGTQSRLLAFS